MRQTKTRRFLQLASLSLLGGACVVLLSYAGYRLQLGFAPAAFLCLIVVVLVSLGGYLLPAALTSVVALLTLNYFLVPPLFEVRLAHPLDEITAGAFLATALVINRLMARLRQSLSEVQALNERLQLVVDTIPSLVARTRGDGSFEFMNQRWREYLGLPLDEAKDWGWTAALHPDDRERFMDQWRTALSSGEPLESEARMRRADGEYHWLSIGVVPLRDSEGKIVNWYGSSTDIEERKRAEERARQAVRERDIAIDTIPALLWSTLPDGSSDFNNERWLEYTGLSETEARGWGYRSVIHPEDYQRLATEWAANFATGEPIEDEARLRRADGQYRWFLHRVVPLRDEGGDIVKWYGTSTDIEDLKRAQGVLREQARLLDLTHDTVFVRDMNDVITYWNRGAEALYGWSRDEAVGKVSHQLTQTTFPTPLDEINEELRRTGRWEGELVHIKRDGTRVVVASRWSLQRDDQGRPAAILETNNDVHERKRAEAELRASEARYRHIFQSAGVSIWEEDFSAVKAAIEDVKAQGVTDFREYLATHPDFILRAISLVKITDVNDTTLTLLRARSKDELVVSLHKVFLPETQEVFARELVAIAEGRTTFEAETVLQTMEGKRLGVFLTMAFPADSAALDSVLVSMMDITERKRLDTELRRSQAYLIAAQELGNTGSWAHLISTGEMYWSEEVFRIFGLDPKTTIPTRELATSLWHPDDREFAYRTIDDALRDQRTYEMDVRMVRPDGSIRYVHSRGQPMFDKTGEIDEFIGVVMDITDRKRAERALRRARERALEARFTAVIEERTRLARDIHDTLLQGFTGIALKLVAAINRITGPVESVVALRDLVGLTQQTLIEARRAVWDLRAPRLAAGDFPAAVRTAAEDCVRGTTLELEYDIGGPPRAVDPDIETVVVRVAQEAVTNVVKHAAARTVRVRLSFETRRLRLSVIDDGRGFAVASDFHTYGGHWGLLGMRERASQVHGKLSLRSSPGHGTELVLLVPYAPGHRSLPSAPRPAPPSE